MAATTTFNFSQRYQPIYKENQVTTGTGQVAIASGWTVYQSIVKHLSRDQYAAIGQLYSSTRGITFLLANLLANPQVRDIAILSATSEDSSSNASKCLYDFFIRGFEWGTSDMGVPCWIIRSSEVGYIDSAFSRELLEKLRQNVTAHYFISRQELILTVKELAQRDRLPVWGSSQEVLLDMSEPKTYPGPKYGHRIEGKTIAETWVKIVHRIKTTGVIRPTGYDGQWQELIDLMAVVTDEPEGFYFPEPNYLPVDREFVDRYIPQILEDAPYQEGVKYTYGQRLRSWFEQDQIQQVVSKLVNEPDSASAVMSLWDVQDHIKGDSPCLNHIWVRIVDRELSLTATLRSNDMFSAWPANAMGLRALQRHIWEEVSCFVQIGLGPLITISQSAHIYDDSWENASNLIDTQYKRIVSDRDFHDPSGHFEVEVDRDRREIVAHRLEPKRGDRVATYRQKKPLRLLREICADTPSLFSEHAGYLGVELQKAYYALFHNTTYEQDKD